MKKTNKILTGAAATAVITSSLVMPVAAFAVEGVTEANTETTVENNTGVNVENKTETIVEENAVTTVDTISIESTEQGKSVKIPTSLFEGKSQQELLEVFGLQGLQVAAHLDVVKEIYGDAIHMEMTDDSKGQKTIQVVGYDKFLYNSMSEGSNFKDIANHWAKEEISFLNRLNVVQGVSPTEFKPNQSITRAQFAVMLARTIPFEADTEVKFDDSKGQWFEKEVALLNELGIVNGTSEKTFEPNKKITRQQAAAMVQRYVDTFGLDDNYSSKGKDFKDKDKIGDYAQEAVAMLSGMGVIDGKEGGIFDPYGELTRGQMAKILWNTLSLTPDSPIDEDVQIVINYNLMQIVSLAYDLKSNGETLNPNPEEDEKDKISTNPTPSKPSVEELKGDKVSPILILENKNQSNEWQKGEALIEITATDSLELGELKLPNGEVKQLSGKEHSLGYNVSQNGTYEFVLIDEAGNSSTQQVVVENIDNDAPEIKIEVAYADDTQVVLMPRITDKGVGVEFIKMPFSDKLESVGGSFTTAKNGVFTFEAADKLGNTIAVKHIVDSIKSTEEAVVPITTFLTKINSSGDVKVTLEAEHPAGISRIILPNGQEVDKNEVTVQFDENGVYKFKIHTFSGHSEEVEVIVTHLAQ